MKKPAIANKKTELLETIEKSRFLRFNDKTQHSRGMKHSNSQHSVHICNLYKKACHIYIACTLKKRKRNQY